MGGFECSTHINAQGRLDMIAAVGHDRLAAEDYRRLREVGIRTARDGLRWHLIDRGGTEYDWSSFAPMLDAAARQGIEVIWDLLHYGFAEGVDPFSAEFPKRFARFSRAVARFVRERSDEVPFYAPVNEISFFTWAGSRDVMWPFAFGRDDEFKNQLVRAAIASVEAIWSVDRRARICWPEPIINVLTPADRPDLAAQARAEYESQFEAWDRIRSAWPEALDIIGVNYYYGNQWETHTRRFLDWEPEKRDHRWKPFPKMLEDTYRRYERPLFIAETGHFGIGRAPWIRDIAADVGRAIAAGTPVEGVCLYPIIDRPDWQNENHWHNSGLWDLHRNGTGDFERVLHAEYAAALGECQGLSR